ncbi:MAG: DUF3883 domain-containing protein [Bacteroidetes bacterium]|nr:DUF3883 domain-containing protein [Bacteroidota bacterium]
MLEELKQFNTIGDRSGILFLSRQIFCEGVSNAELLRNKSVINPEIRLNPKLSLKFLMFLDLIHISGEEFSLTKKGVYLQNNFENTFYNKIGLLVIKRLIDLKILDINSIKIETRGSVVFYELPAFPLNAAIFRNFLIEIGLLQNIKGIYYLHLPKDQEESFVRTIRKRHRLISQDELLKKLEKQREQGIIAEKWVVEYEKRRILNHDLIEKIKLISDIDIQAGYDILSFNNRYSTHYDRCIEVKSYSDNLHFYWSKNESEIAFLKGDNYFLYLIDINKISNPNYEPLIIKNPKKVLHEDNNWIVETQTYLISKIQGIDF